MEGEERFLTRESPFADTVKTIGPAVIRRNVRTAGRSGTIGNRNAPKRLGDRSGLTAV